MAAVHLNAVCFESDFPGTRISCESEINKLAELGSSENSRPGWFGGLIGFIGKIDIVQNTKVRLA